MIRFGVEAAMGLIALASLFSVFCPLFSDRCSLTLDP